MPTRTSKFRGSRTHGRGKKAGRGAGKRGGRGNAGLHKHRYLSVIKYAPDHFGKHGFKRHHALERRNMKGGYKVINVGELEARLRNLLRAGYGSEETVEGDEGKKIIKIDLCRAGYNKLLGAGDIKTKVEVTTYQASERAINKIEHAGGKVVIIKER